MCAICLTTMKPGDGHAIFTGECSHSFHFHCITSKNPPDLSHIGARLDNVSLAQNDDWTTVLRRLPPRAHSTSLNKDVSDDRSTGAIEVKTYPEISAVSRSTSHNNFTILVHLKALTSRRRDCGLNKAKVPPISQNSLAPVDLVAVLDVSGSMAGTKLALLKRAMGFVIQHLGPSDRLSVIAFSSNGRRLFPLHRMTDTGRQEALQAVNGLISNGGTNIADGLKKGAKVMTDRKWKNPVGSIILLSDGQDTHTVNGTAGSHPQSDYQSLLPFSVHWNGSTGLHIPVHAFGFGEDHDSALMHSISESSGETFTFIDAESFIKDAFAQCIGGLLSVVVQELQVRVECVHPTLKLCSIKAGNYKTSVMPDGRLGFIDVGDLYAEEERDFWGTVDIPVDGSSNEMLRAAEAIVEARVTAERGDLAGAVSVLEGCLEVMSETVSLQAGDRAYVLSGLSSHSWQRATARGDSTDSTSLVQSYQTPSMVDTVNRSQTVFLGSPLPQPPSARRLRQAKSFPAQPQPRLFNMSTS
ncbi:Von Willebrand factor, type A protein [Actinidia chinensis var. chinensis]|uniref:von Willebrand factor, type A protein n=1 Tax=Actinidia chinensis var. chinensis TaxID=1590841 RepID=A0A2R6QTG1_ACTCC|nr:Von Willebrand factor, type A protein [Actinidia chinensis var. chinensis]